MTIMKHLYNNSKVICYAECRLHDDVITYFESSLSPEAAVITFDGNHGRIETRSVPVTSEIDWLKENHSWEGLKSITAVTATRETSNKIMEEARYFISSA